MSVMLKFESEAEVQDYAQKNGKILVICDEKVLDVTSFAAHHPGGDSLILKYSSKHIEQEMKTHYPLSLIMADSMTIGSFKNEVQHLINSQKPLMPQIWNLNHQQYLKIVQSPHWLFVESPRMFHHMKWYHIYFIPIIVFMRMVLSIQYQIHKYKLLEYIGIFCLGVFSFTLLEYILHRFIFHSEKYLLDNRILRYIHFITHGIHHMIPLDPDRLLFPPALMIIVMSIGYYTLYQILQFNDNFIKILFWIGFGVGYLIYDTFHYLIHHVKFKRGSYMATIQSYHNKHHFSGQFAGFGVSSKFWDIVFQTELSHQKKH